VKPYIKRTYIQPTNMYISTVKPYLFVGTFHTFAVKLCIYQWCAILGLHYIKQF